MGMKKVVSSLVTLVLSVVASNAYGLTFTATRPGNDPGETLKATATFTVSNLDLIITLSNDATFDPNDRQDILSGVFFNIAGDPKLTPVSAELEPDSMVIAHPLPLGFTGDVGGEWAYRNDLKKAPLGANEGVSAANLKWFGKKKYLFPGERLHGAGHPGNVDFGLTTLFDLPGNNKGSIKHKGLIENAIVLVLEGLPVDFTLADISNVTFQYGNKIKEPEITGEAIAVIPEPSTIMLVATGLLGVLTVFRRRIACGSYSLCKAPARQ
jgi:hypothetical protein